MSLLQDVQAQIKRKTDKAIRNRTKVERKKIAQSIAIKLIRKSPHYTKEQHQ